jgi:thiol-disulfide isomerase/thioredoxin
LRKTLLTTGGTLGVLMTVGLVLFLRNAAPVVPAISSVDPAGSSKPYVVKLHARWCPVCMMTKDVWSQVETAYAGRVNFLVFDFTDQATTDRSRAEAKRLGLEKFFDESSGVTGTIAVLDGRTRETTATIHGSRNFDEYRAAIDASLRTATP